uniref:Uncharacterized protein n=1 Tax=Magnetococcus massalia (strain MO-1) TaxID=451514 RepID=A0A1S7LLK2_MAGMO|nr:conserved protein of unknown function [Candidatus Magnetococcus massalia]
MEPLAWLGIAGAAATVWYLWERSESSTTLDDPPPPTPKPSPPPAAPSPPASKKPKPAPVAEKAPEPKPEPKPAPVAEKAPEPKPEPKPAPVAEKAPEPKPEPKPAPVAEKAPEPKPEPKPAPVAEKAPEPKPAPEPVAEPVVAKEPEPAAKPAVKPVAEKAPEPAPAPAEEKKTAVIYPEVKPLQLPVLPEKFDKEYKGKNPLDTDQESHMNPGQLLCDCADFKANRANQPEHDIRRVCACLAQKLTQVRAKGEFEPLVWSAVVGGKQHNHEGFVETKLLGSPAGIGFTPGNDVVALHCRVTKRGDAAGKASGDYKVFEYNVVTKSWLDPAPPAAVIKAAEKQLNETFKEG